MIAIPLLLSHELRLRSRVHAVADDGRAVTIVLPRHARLLAGQQVTSTDGTLLEIRAAPEAVSTVYGANAHLRARLCYHLGNRHVAVQIGDDWLRYLRDAVLDDLVQQLGAAITHETVPFEPETGAYANTHSHE